MPRGIGAVVFVVALIFSMSILGSVGFYQLLGPGVDIHVEGQNEDVQDAAESLAGVQPSGERSSSILEGPLAVVTPIVGAVGTLWTVVFNTSGVLQLLYGVPAVVADTLQLFFQLALAFTVLYLIRSGSPV